MQTRATYARNSFVTNLRLLVRPIHTICDPWFLQQRSTLRIIGVAHTIPRITGHMMQAAITIYSISVNGQFRLCPACRGRQDNDRLSHDSYLLLHPKRLTPFLTLRRVGIARRRSGKKFGRKRQRKNCSLFLLRYHYEKHKKDLERMVVFSCLLYSVTECSG